MLTNNKRSFTLTTKKVVIKIDITDWDEEYQDNEVNVSSEDEIIKRAKEGIKPSEMGRHIIVSREHGLSPEGIIRPNKTILNIGAAEAVSKLIARRYKNVTIKNDGGKTLKIRALTCATEDAEESVVVDSDTEAGLQNAISYTLNVIPGHIRSRLDIIRVNGGNVKKVGRQLITIVQEIIDSYDA